MPKGELKHADESELAADIRDAIGAGPDEKVEGTIPQFTREPGQPKPSSPPGDFESLRQLDSVALREMGCRPWDEPDVAGRVLMLFPGEWYDAIPDGMSVVDINGQVEDFVAGETDDDIRCGCLAFGFEVYAKKEE